MLFAFGSLSFSFLPFLTQLECSVIHRKASKPDCEEPAGECRRNAASGTHWRRMPLFSIVRLKLITQQYKAWNRTQFNWVSQTVIISVIWTVGKRMNYWGHLFKPRKVSWFFNTVSCLFLIWDVNPLSKRHITIKVFNKIFEKTMHAFEYCSL